MSLSTSPRRAVLALTLAAACWGIGTVVSKYAIDEIPSLTLLPIPLGSSLVALALLMRWRGLPFRDPSASPILGRLGVLNPGLAYALSLLGLAFITASLSVMLWAIEPLLILVFAGWFLHERITPVLVGLSLVAVAGMLLVIYQPNSIATPLGVALTVAGVACCAIYTVVTRRWLATASSTSQVIIAQQAYALAFGLRDRPTDHRNGARDTGGGYRSGRWTEVAVDEGGGDRADRRGHQIDPQVREIATDDRRAHRAGRAVGHTPMTFAPGPVVGRGPFPQARVDPAARERSP